MNNVKGLIKKNTDSFDEAFKLFKIEIILYIDKKYVQNLEIIVRLIFVATH